MIINGPNLNLLEKREVKFYGNKPFEVFLDSLKEKYKRTFDIKYFQSNVEGEIIDKIQEIGFDYHGIVLNAGAYTHTSIAIRDAIIAINTPVIEVHISNIFSREEFRKNSFIAPVCKGSISGFGLNSYVLAIENFLL